MGKTMQPAHQLYLGIAAMQGMASLPALLLARNGLLSWNEGLQAEAKILEKKLKAHPLKHLARALKEEVAHQFNSLQEGIAQYLAFPYQREMEPVPAVWSQGATRVLDYTQQPKTEKPLVLFVPSLINRAYILDLGVSRSFVRFLASEGYGTMMVDWGEPGKSEKGFSCREYITERLEKIIGFLANKEERPIILAGYCMGGLLALAAALRCQEKIAALALFATPWDFHSGNPLQAAYTPYHLLALEHCLQQQGHVPKETVRQWFYMLQIQSVHRKFQNFSTADKTSEAAFDFVAIQHWIDDGVEMTGGVAKDCFIDWAYHNIPFRGRWEVAGTSIQPGKWNRPSFIAIPQHDRIVPPASSKPLQEQMPYTTVICPDTGHIGMVAGYHARKELWEPFVVWLEKIQE